MNGLEDALREFVGESHENLDQLERDLVALEKAPQDSERLKSVFRIIHTIKGTCGFFEFRRLGALTHAGENLLSRLRDGSILLDPAITNALLALVDAVRRCLKHIETTGAEIDDEYPAIIESLTRLQDGQRTQAKPDTPPAPEPEVGVPVEDFAQGVAEGNIRVDVDLLDRLMNLVGELVLARNQVLQVAASQSDVTLVQASQRLSQITTELQEGVMKTRMQPIGNVWNRFPRVVRDLAKLCGKEVRVSMEGAETELDRTILEAIRDPLTHLVRNSIDHGLETPEERRNAGKLETGHLTLRAFHEGGQVNIEVRDDGRGMNPAGIRQKAVDRGLLTAEQADRLEDRDLFRLVFLPGFSTAERVTTISGRGVGMDVVKTNIEKIGGTVDLESRQAQGTTVKVKIPLTLAIIPALIVTAGAGRYAIPQVSLLELVRLDEQEARRRIQDVSGAPVCRLRDKLLPLVSLNRLLELEPNRGASEVVTIVVLQAGGRSFGLVVDRVQDTHEIVVKPLARPLKGMLYAGATILGDGRVTLILDVTSLAQRARILGEVGDKTAVVETMTTAVGAEDRQAWLVCGVGRDRRVAIRLNQVERLDVIRAEAVEQAAGQEVVQYRGGLLPLVRLDEGGADSGLLHLVVSSGLGRRCGLVVGRILDTVEDCPVVQQSGRQPGLIGSAVVQKRVTDLLDLPALLQAQHSHLFDLAAQTGRV